MGQYMYKNLSALTLQILSVSMLVSTAHSERVF